MTAPNQREVEEASAYIAIAIEMLNEDGLYMDTDEIVAQLNQALEFLGTEGITTND